MYWTVKAGRTRENNELIHLGESIKTDWEASDNHTDNWADNQEHNWADNQADNQADNWADNQADN